MLENPIGRSPKAWGLGQKLEICFPPARGAYFSIKWCQTPNGEGFYEGVGLPAARAWPQVPCFFRLFCVTSILYRFLSKKCPQKCENQRFWSSFWAPKRIPLETLFFKLFVIFKTLFGSKNANSRLKNTLFAPQIGVLKNCFFQDFLDFYFGSMLVPSWPHLGSHPGLSWPLLAHLGLSWPHLGSILAPSWPLLASLCALLAPS